MNSTLFFIKILENSNAAYFGLHCKSSSGKSQTTGGLFQISINHFILLGSFKSFPHSLI